MRLALAISLLTATSLQVEFLRAESPAEAGLSLRYERDDKGSDWGAATAIADDFNGNCVAVLSELTTEYATQLKDSPLALLRAVIADRGAHVVWDEKVGKYRPVTTGQHAPQEWQLTGTTLRVEGEPGDDGKATKEVTRRAGSLAAELFAADATPADQMEHLIAWRKKGKLLTKLERHAMPDSIPFALVANPAQVKLAAEAVAVKAVGRPAKK